MLHPGSVQFLVAIEHDAAGRITGTVAPEAGPTQAFAGWLELARLLEPRDEQHTARQDGTAAVHAARLATADTREVSS